MMDGLLHEHIRQQKMVLTAKVSELVMHALRGHRDWSFMSIKAAMLTRPGKSGPSCPQVTSEATFHEHPLLHQERARTWGKQSEERTMEFNGANFCSRVD